MILVTLFGGGRATEAPLTVPNIRHGPCHLGRLEVTYAERELLARVLEGHGVWVLGQWGATVGVMDLQRNALVAGEKSMALCPSDIVRHSPELCALGRRRALQG
jgi:hypothetical protein